MGKEHKEYTWNLIAKKLAGEANPAELKELEDLLRSNPGLHYPVQTIADLWEHTSPLDKVHAEEAFNRHLDRISYLNIDYPTSELVIGGPLQKPAFQRQMLILAPALLFFAGCMFFLFRPKPHSLPSGIAQTIPASREITTHSGSRTRITLPDSTKVWVNAGSSIQYEKNFGIGSREVSLSGEAFFDVTPDASRPFIIHARKVDVRVLGTSFNLKSYSTDKTTEATLIRGSIEISIRNRPNNTIILKPNEKLVVNNEDSVLLKKITRHRLIAPESIVVISKPTYEQHSGAIIETSWVDNKLIFQDEEFGDLARQMERWYGVSIRFDDPLEEELRFTGIFEKETIRQALDALKLTAKFDYNIQGTEVTIHN